MKKINKIPTSKIQRASKLISTGAKVGINYMKYYGEKMIHSEEEAKKHLDESNAEVIYDSLKELKGSALKVAQMMSMDDHVLPEAYVDKFSLSQFSVPPISGPLVVQTFKKSFGKTPTQVYDSFDTESIHAASIGQVHVAEKDGMKLAVKIQYPGVANSISSDLALVKPVALRILKMKAKDAEIYFREVESKLLEETDYKNELKQGVEVKKLCAHLPNMKFPNYYEALSNEKVITMDWMNGKHLSEFYNSESVTQEELNKIGQTLWDFYMFQLHQLKKVHADPHPGNFLVSEEGELIALDFGCMKSIPEEFYKPYFGLTQPGALEDKPQFEKLLRELNIFNENDTAEEHEIILSLFHELLSITTRPFHSEYFDFSDPTFFNELAEIGERLSKDKKLKQMSANRGSAHFIYVNRTFFGLYNLMHRLKAKKVSVLNYIHSESESKKSFS